MRLKVLGSAEDALRAMTEQLIEKMNMRGISPFHLALSGAGTAQQMFGLWIREYREKIKWEQLRFYWVDERVFLLMMRRVISNMRMNCCSGLWIFHMPMSIVFMANGSLK